MVGVGKLLKQAQKMQQKMEEAQASLAEEILEVQVEAVRFPSRSLAWVNSKI